MCTRFAHRHRRRAMVLVLIVVLLPVLVGMAALTVDVGYMQAVVAEAQNAADAAAFAAASAFTGPSGLFATEGQSELVTSRALEYVARNIALKPTSSVRTIVELGRWDEESASFVALAGDDARRADAVRVAVTRFDMPYFFAAIFGKHRFDVTREAVASVGRSGGCRLWSLTHTHIKNDSFTDSYDASAGPYDPLSAGSQGHVCACNKIDLKDNAVINGDALYANEGRRSGFVGDPANVTGKIELIPDCFTPLLEFDLGLLGIDNDAIGLTDGGDDPFQNLKDEVEVLFIDLLGNNDNAGIPVTFRNRGELGGKKLELHVHNDELTFPPGTYYFKKLKLHKNTTLFLTGPTTIFIESELDLHDSSIVNPSKDPRDLVIVHAGLGKKKIHFKNTGDLYAYILAPGAKKVKFEKGGDLFGALIGKHVEFKGGRGGSRSSSFHADESFSFSRLSGGVALVK